MGKRQTGFTRRGKRLGNKVILMSTSTGGTLALKLAADYLNFDVSCNDNDVAKHCHL